MGLWLAAQGDTRWVCIQLMLERTLFEGNCRRQRERKHMIYSCVSMAAHVSIQRSQNSRERKLFILFFTWNVTVGFMRSRSCPLFCFLNHLRVFARTNNFYSSRLSSRHFYYVISFHGVGRIFRTGVETIKSCWTDTVIITRGGEVNSTSSSLKGACGSPIID